MASSAPLNDAALPSAPAKETGALSLRTALLFIVLGATIASVGFGGTLYYWSRTGRLTLRENLVTKHPVTASTTTHLIPLEPFVVNLGDETGNSYLRLAMTLQVTDSHGENNLTEKNSKISEEETALLLRDAILNVLGRQTSSSLLAPEGKEHLKAELKSALAQYDTNLQVKEIFFTDFLVQQ